MKTTSKQERRNIIVQVISELIVVPVLLFLLMLWVGAYTSIAQIYCIIVGFQILAAILSVITQKVTKDDDDGKGSNI
jgi:hypothetical protein